MIVNKKQHIRRPLKMAGSCKSGREKTEHKVYLEHKQSTNIKINLMFPGRIMQEILIEFFMLVLF